MYQKTRGLAKEVYQFTRNGSFSGDHGLVDQVRRGAISVVSNIAEGFERGCNAELSRMALPCVFGLGGAHSLCTLVTHDEICFDLCPA